MQNLFWEWGLTRPGLILKNRQPSLMVPLFRIWKTSNLTLDLEFHQHLGSIKHVINIIMWIRDTGCYSLWWQVPTRQMHRRWRRGGSSSAAVEGRTAKYGWIGGRRCLENNRLGSTGREWEMGRGSQCLRGGRRRKGRGALHSGRQHSAGAVRFEMNSTIFTDSNGFKNLQTYSDSKSIFLCYKNVK
jgi:hypothetical protein